jgi:hypothetical protein
MAGVFLPGILEHIRVVGDLEGNVFTDFAGTRFPQGSFPVLPSSDTRFTNLQTDGDGFRSGSDEWSALVIALLCFSSESPVLIELGASQGLWCVPWIRHAEILNLKGAHALAVEASASKIQALNFWEAQGLKYSTTHTIDGFELSGSNWNFSWLHAAVSTIEGFVSFPDVNVESDNGASVNPVTHVGHRSRTIQVRSITPAAIASWLRETTFRDKVALLHLDLQGAEESLVSDRGFENLVSKTDVVVIGTHSIESEQISIKTMSRLDYCLLAINLSKYKYEKTKTLFQDGEQVWASKAIVERATELNLINWTSNEEILADALYELCLDRDSKGLTSET